MYKVKGTGEFSQSDYVPIISSQIMTKNITLIQKKSSILEDFSKTQIIGAGKKPQADWPW